MSLEEKYYFPQFELMKAILSIFYVVINFVIYTLTETVETIFKNKVS